MNQHNSSFARSLPPRAVAIGRTIQPPPLGRPATIYDAAYPGLSYDPDAGVFQRNGKVINTVANNGYVVVWDGQAMRKAHRLAWRFYYGVWPANCIDHRNGDRSDNRIENLREATVAQNNRNKSPTPNRALPKGVSAYTKGKGFFARICVNRKNIHLGTFVTVEAAAAAYREAALRHHRDFARVS